jgi:putative radical SAM enzyme (TIGR03279 family)
MNRRGLRVKTLEKRTAEGSGIRPGDRILRVNGHRVEDELDFRFYTAGEGAIVEVRGAEDANSRRLRISAECVSGLGFAPMRSRRCRNRCLFCFVDQMPDGLRRSLYVKDEDYRFSFLYGNYVTLASVKDEELDRICRLRLQPMYVSVHATEPRLRNLLLGRRKSRDVMETLRVLADADITTHTQVVVCPGINDGRALENTVLDLASLYPAVASIAIVPVGLTRYRKEKGLWPIRGIRKDEAAEIVKNIEGLQILFKRKYDNPLVLPADEFYRLANLPFPPAADYGDFPQWENGVGMVPSFLEQQEQIRKEGVPWKTGKSPDFLAVTGESAYPFVAPYVEWLRRATRAALRLVPVRNRLFGKSVNVAGLITGKDIVKQIRPLLRAESVVLVPDVMLSREEERFLDDMSLTEMEEALSVPVEKFKADPRGLEQTLRKYLKGL